MNLKSILKWKLAAVILVGVCFAVYPFVRSLGPSERAENDATLKIDISDMEVGDVKHIQNSYYLYKENENGFLLMNGWAPFRGCPIHYVKAGEGKYTYENKENYNEKAHFYDPCDGTIWELSGTLVEWTAYHKERDMLRREFEMHSGEYILFHIGKS